MDNSDKLKITQAIKCALSQNWQEAVLLNQQLSRKYPHDTEALNRLAYAYLKSGNLQNAKTAYKKVLKIDKYNPIALKNLRWLENVNQDDIHTDTSISSTPTIFLEEPGKTKIVTLVDLAPAKILCNIITAQQVFLIAKKHRIEIRNGKNLYIGALPDDLSHRLLKFINTGNEYDAYIKNCTKNCVSVFIREMKRTAKYINHPSFVLSHNYAYQGESETEGTVVKKPAETEDY
jgi:tetratricopeptide (TPR) repeat protein